MNIKILSLSLILFIANFMHGMTTQEKAFYTQELRNAKKDYHNAIRITVKMNKKCHKTNVGKIYLQKWEEHKNCKQLNLDCNATRNALYKADDDYFESEEYKKMVIPLSHEKNFHYLKIATLEKLLSGDNFDIIIKNLEEESTELASDPLLKTIINHNAKIDNRVAQYLRSLPEKRIESTMPEYY